MWSRKYPECIKCWPTEKKHKWHWFCITCYTKKRYYLPSTQKSLNKARVKYRENNPEKMRKCQYLSNKRRYAKYTKAINLMRNISRRIKKGLPCLKIMIKWKERLLPFEWLEKPKATNEKAVKKYKKNLKRFKILKEYYENIW